MPYADSEVARAKAKIYRANRIKNDATLEELVLLGEYAKKLLESKI